jgi:hypothetical protein
MFSSTPITKPQIKEHQIGAACSMHMREENAYKVLVRNPKGKTEHG